MRHVNKHQPPSSLLREEFFVVKCSRATRTVSLYLADTTSYDLGSFWRGSENKIQRVVENGVEIAPHIRRGAHVYLKQALGDDEQLVDHALSVALTHGGAVVELASKRVFPYRKYSTVNQAFEGFMRKHELKEIQSSDPPVYVDPEHVGTSDGVVKNA